jgi:hypothetical protein
MAITLMEMLYHFPRLKYIALIGIAAGSDSTAQQFGDLLIPTNVYNYEMGKYVEERVRRKDKIAVKLAQWILENHLPKAAVAQLYSEGCLVGLVVSIGMEPTSTDAVLIFDIYDRIKQPFTKYKILDTIETLLYRKLFNPTAYKRIRQIFELFSFNADAGLTLKLRKVEKILNKAEFLKIYSMPEGTLHLNKSLRVDAGHPRCLYRIQAICCLCLCAMQARG